MHQNNSNKVSYAFFNAIANIFAVVFVLLIWIQLGVAGNNPMRLVNVYWNHFGEYTAEVIIFGVVGILVIINTIISVRRLKELKK